jgi:hypothetical protein
MACLAQHAQAKERRGQELATALGGVEAGAEAMVAGEKVSARVPDVAEVQRVRGPFMCPSAQ